MTKNPILKFNTFDEVFGRLLKSKKNREIYESELARLHLIRQIRELRRSKKLTENFCGKGRYASISDSTSRNRST